MSPTVEQEFRSMSLDAEVHVTLSLLQEQDSNNLYNNCVKIEEECLR